MPLALRVHVVGLVLGLAAACTDPAIGDPCSSDADCEEIHHDALCWDDGSSKFCTIPCDIEEVVCTRREGTTCVEQETRHRPDPFADDSCDTLGGACEPSGSRTVCR
jgi:hypothetical protein